MNHTIGVPGASIHYELRGRGPLLVLVGGGHSHAGTLAPLAAHLAADHTVLTHDRRGQSRSPVGDPAAPPTIRTHAEDLAHILDAVADGPAQVYGCSIAALITLELTAARPDLVRTLVAHEPPSPALLPEPLRSSADAEQAEAARVYAEQGAMAGLMAFGRIVGVDPADREPGVRPEDPRTHLADLEFFLAHDAPAVRRHRIDLEALKAASAGTRILPVSGTNSVRLWLRRCTVELAAHLGVPWHEVPGAHNGDVFRPAAFAARLRELLAD